MSTVRCARKPREPHDKEDLEDLEVLVVLQPRWIHMTRLVSVVHGQIR